MGQRWKGEEAEQKVDPDMVEFRTHPDGGQRGEPQMHPERDQ